MHPVTASAGQAASEAQARNDQPPSFFARVAEKIKNLAYTVLLNFSNLRPSLNQSCFYEFSTQLTKKEILLNTALESIKISEKPNIEQKNSLKKQWEKIESLHNDIKGLEKRLDTLGKEAQDEWGYGMESPQKNEELTQTFERVQLQVTGALQ